MAHPIWETKPEGQFARPFASVWPLDFPRVWIRHEASPSSEQSRATREETARERGISGVGLSAVGGRGWRFGGGRERKGFRMFVGACLVIFG